MVLSVISDTASFCLWCARQYCMRFHSTLCPLSCILGLVQFGLKTRTFCCSNVVTHARVSNGFQGDSAMGTDNSRKEMWRGVLTQITPALLWLDFLACRTTSRMVAGVPPERHVQGLVLAQHKLGVKLAWNLVSISPWTTENLRCCCTQCPHRQTTGVFIPY